ncbi:MAG: low temperature requirement protein A [Leptolyngbyaceae cyanobacterium bins.59]|nr:low temperature requirement protein A [Leptolyngbyaceae cyanobacterium bins.59]
MTQTLWQPPQLRVGEDREEEHRHATWLELFFDLVFVAAISELAYSLSQNVSLEGYSEFALLFIPVWWSWVGATFYASRFDCDQDLGHRLLTLLQMVLLVVLAVNVHHGLGESSIGYALSYAAVRVVTIVEYIRAAYYIPIARPMAKLYTVGFGCSVLLWVISVFVPIPWRFTLWVIGMIIDLATPRMGSRLVAEIPPHTEHLPERMGLFTIIVLGESILAVVRGVSERNWDVSSAVTAILGMGVAFTLWWLYFETVDGSPLKAIRSGGVSIGLVWLYTHLPLVIGLAGVGVGVEHLVLDKGKDWVPPGDRWLFCGSVILCLLALAGLHLITCSLGSSKRRRILAAYRLGAAAFVLAIAFSGEALSPLALCLVIAFACGVQVIIDLQEKLHPYGSMKVETDQKVLEKD